ncbi:MAG: response regulator [Verrucomicrobia bacterium]|nr:response regulator [Verrucomicrobiota bacterium]
MRILIVVDNPSVSDMVSTMLEDLGHAVAGKAVNGLQALEMSRALKPDLVLMDVSMPEMDGLEATRHIQEECPRPVVLLTSHEEPDIVTLAGLYGAGAYLVKPAEPLSLERTMAIAVARFADLMTLRRLNAELETALREIKTLRGLIPICCYCKKISDDKGFWNQVEAYVQEHSEARFTHGFCPDCLNKLYPGLMKT